MAPEKRFVLYIITDRNDVKLCEISMFVILYYTDAKQSNWIALNLMNRMNLELEIEFNVIVSMDIQ